MDFAQLPDCNPSPDDTDTDDKPIDICTCADCGIEYPRCMVRPWVGTAYICVDCTASANRLPTEKD